MELIVKFILCMLVIFLSTQVTASTKSDVIQENRVKIGPITTSPVSYNNKIYFLANTGVLFKSNYDQSVIQNIFKTNKSTFSGLTLHKEFVYFGEGLHKDNQSYLFAYNLKTQKLAFKQVFDGHIERRPLYYKDIIYVGHGPGGISAYSTKTKKILWTQKKTTDGLLHVDATPIPFERNGRLEVCVPSIYKFKGLACLDAKTGDILHTQKLLLSPKSETRLVNGYMIGYATKGTMNDNEFKTPSRFYIYNLKEKKLVKDIVLRGYNFYPPIIEEGSKVFVTLSTGDLITINLTDGKIGYVSEFPEPFISTPFKIKDELCAIGIMGKLLCFKKTKSGYSMSKEKRYYETPIGNIEKEINKKLYIPSRMGYFHL